MRSGEGGEEEEEEVSSLDGASPRAGEEDRDRAVVWGAMAGGFAVCGDRAFPDDGEEGERSRRGGLAECPLEGGLVLGLVRNIS